MKAEPCEYTKKSKKRKSRVHARKTPQKAPYAMKRNSEAIKAMRTNLGGDRRPKNYLKKRHTPREL